ncbi:MAG: hypothetical protein KH585_07555 [Oscillibacter sp.]|nr:hypothetical protein [Oscillibacter sp.]
MDEKKYSQLYQALLQEVLQFHNGNQRRIRKGMLSLLLVPLVFLVLLFLSEGSRVIFLLLWIVSMFGIAAYLIAVEYIDYEMQNKVKKITKKEVELDQLTPLPSAMPQLLPLLRGRGQEPDLPPDPPQEEQESFAQSAAQAEEDLDQLLQGLRGIETAAAPEPQPRPGGAAQQEDGGAFARLFDDQAWDRYYGSPEAETPAAEPESVTESAAEPAPVSEPVFVPENPAPVPPASQAAPQPVSPDLNQALAGLQTDVQQLAQGLDQLSRELGRISRYMEDQKNRTKEERK